jgi:hypothetical protein
MPSAPALPRSPAGHLDHDARGVFDLLRRQRVELTGAAGDEDAARARGDTGGDVPREPSRI